MPEQHGAHAPKALRVTHPFPLRPDFLVQLEAPFDMTEAEADRLAHWLVTLGRPDGT